MLGRRGVLRFLALPPYVWLALFLVVPVGLIATISLRPEPGPLSFDDPWTPSLVQYQRNHRDAGLPAPAGHLRPDGAGSWR